MDSTFRQILRHASVFGLGAILSRLASILLLPLYTRYLRPADYGTIALVDLTVGLLAIAGGAGIASAATREHFRAQSGRDLDRIWWTAVSVVAALATVVFVPAFVAREALAHLAFGGDVKGGGYFLGLAIPTLWLAIVTGVVDAYFRAQKASGYMVSLGLVRLVLSILLNVGLLAYFGGGVAPILWGNLVAAAIAAAVQVRTFARTRGSFVFDRSLVRPYWHFGWPLVIYGVLSSMMHEADRYILRVFSDLDQVGLYSIAYQIGQGVNTLVIAPFITIWSVLIYELEKQDDAPAIYARVFKHFVAGLALALFLASLFAEPALRLIAPPEYLPAAGIVPIVCLAYLFFSLHEHFKVPALLARQTVALLPAVTSAVVVNLVANFLLVPRMGGVGAAWASVITFAFFSGIGLMRYRSIARYPYPFVRCGLIVAGLAATYLGHRTIAVRLESVTAQLVLAVVLWCGWAAALYGGAARDLGVLYGLLPRSLGDGNTTRDGAAVRPSSDPRRSTA